MSDIIAKAGGVTPESYVKGASLKRQLTEDELKRMETLLALSEANKQSRDSIGVALMNVKDYSVGIDLEKALANPGSIDDVVLRDGDELYIQADAKYGEDERSRDLSEQRNLHERYVGYGLLVSSRWL